MSIASGAGSGGRWRPARAAVFAFVVALNAVEPCDAQPNVTAPGGVAVGRDIANSTIKIYSHDPEEIKRLAEQLDRSEGDRRAAEAKAAALARQLDLSNVTTQAVVGFLRVLSRQPDLKVEEVPAKMAEITATYLQMEERISALPADNPIKPLAQAAAESGAYDRAERLLAAGQLQIKAVEFIDKGQPDQALAALSEAEQRLGEVSMNSSAHERLVQGYLFKTYEQAFWAQGDKIQADQYLAKARGLFQSVARETGPEGIDAEQFASAMNGMGNLLYARGDYRGAIRDSQVAVALAPGYAYAWHDIFLAYAKLADQGEVDLPAMRNALAKTKETGKGWPVLTPSYIAQLDAILARVEQANKQGTKPRVK